MQGFLHEWVDSLPHKQPQLVGISAVKGMAIQLAFDPAAVVNRFPPPDCPSGLPTKPHWVSDDECIEFVLEKRFGHILPPRKKSVDAALTKGVGMPGGQGSKKPEEYNLDDFEEVQPVSQVVSTMMKVNSFGSKLKLKALSPKKNSLPPLAGIMKDKNASGLGAAASLMKQRPLAAIGETPTTNPPESPPVAPVRPDGRVKDEAHSDTSEKENPNVEQLHQLAAKLDAKVQDIQRREEALAINPGTQPTSSCCTIA
jgi:hypothetical protein